ncbi:MAG: hypothetical protein WBX15_16795, partial [Thermoanaerobaculia bacterium]
MGTWGIGVLADDFAADVYDAFMRRFDALESRETIITSLAKQFAEEVLDVDEGPVFWLALAKAAWDTGPISTELRDRVRSIVESGRGLERWSEGGGRELAKRKKVLGVCAVETVLLRKRISGPNPSEFSASSHRYAPQIRTNLA